MRPPADAGAVASTPHLVRHVMPPAPPISEPQGEYVGPNWWLIAALIGLYTGAVLALGAAIGPPPCVVKTTSGQVISIREWSKSR